ncbi:MAG: hypothetical protein ACRC1U_06445 [Vibrionaceae bacterium]
MKDKNKKLIMLVTKGSTVTAIGPEDNTTRSGEFSLFCERTFVKVSVSSSQPNQYGVVHSTYKINDISGLQQQIEFTAVLNALEAYRTPTQTRDDLYLGMRSGRS